MRLIEGSRTRNIYSIINEELRNGKAVIVAKTGLSASDNKAKEILNSVVGQMSDGIWENTPGYDRYWKNVDVTEEDGEIVIYGGTAYGSPFLDYHSSTGVKDESAVRKFMAHKIKQIVKIEAEDGNGDIIWKRDCETPLSYMGYDETITVRDCYRVYDKLLGRVDRIAEGSIISMNTDNFKDVVMRDFQIFIEDKYDINDEDELVERLKQVSEDDVNEYFTGMFYDILDYDDLDSANEAEKIIRTEYNLLDNVNESANRLNEDFWNPGKYFSLLQDMENIDTEKWNSTNDQSVRDEMVRPFLIEFWNKYKEEMTEEDIAQLFDDMEDSNYHTEYRLLSQIIKESRNINESTKAKKKDKKEKKPEERVIMQQGNVTCLKKDNKFKVFEDTDTNLAEYDNQEEAMRDALGRCGVNPDNELSEEKDNLKESTQYQVVKTLEVGPNNYQSEVHGTYDTYEQAEDICGELNAQGIRATVKETLDIDEELKVLLLKKEELYNDESIDDDDYYHQVEIIDNIIINNYSLEEIDEAMKALGIDDSE